MRARRDPVPRAKEAWWWLGGVLTLGLGVAGLVVAGIALWENIDIRQLAPELQEPPPPLPAPSVPPATSRAADVSFSTALFMSQRNRDYFPDPDFYGTQIARWSESAKQVGGVVRVVSEAEGLRTVAPDDVLLIPEAPCLSSSERAAIMAHLERGGSLVTNWALGVRDERCRWWGWETLMDVTGAEAIRELDDRSDLYFTVPDGLPSSVGLDPGTRVALRPDPAVALRMPGRRVYWSDWALNPAPDRIGLETDVAVATTVTRSEGRVAWFGARFAQGASVRDEALLERVFQNGIRWAGGAPYAAVSPWPAAARGALVFLLDVEGEAYRNAADVATLFRSDGIPISFFAVSQLVEDDDSLAQILVSAGEVGTQTVDHRPLAGLTAQEQRIRLRRSWNDLEAWTGVAPQGLRPPEELSDAVTLEAWRRAGGSYVLGDNEGRSAAPEIHQTEDGPVILIPRLMKDDYTVIVRDVTLRSQRLAEAFLAGTRKLRAIGGLGVVAGHTQIIEPGARLDAFHAVADSMRAEGGWWIAEARDVARWWLDRSRVELTWAPVDPTVLERVARVVTPEDLLVSLEEGASLSDLWVDVVAPLPERSIPLVDGVSADFMEASWGMRVRVGDLSGGDVRRISFVLMEDVSQTSDGAQDGP